MTARRANAGTVAGWLSPSITVNDSRQRDDAHPSRGPGVCGVAAPEERDLIGWELDLETRRFTHLSGRVAAALGYPSDSWRDQPGFWIGVLHPDDRARVAQAIWSMVRRPGTCEVEYRAVAIDGRVLRMRDRVRAVADESGRARFLRAASLDVSDPGSPASYPILAARDRSRRRSDPIPESAAEPQQIAEEVHLRANLLDGLGEAVVASDLDHRIVYWNDAAAKLFGWSAQEAIGRPDIELLPSRPSREQNAAIIAGLVHGRPWAAEVEIRSRHGVVIPVLMTVGPVRSEDGVPAGVVAVVTDLRRLRASDAKARRAYVMSVVARMAAGIGAEIDRARRRIDEAARRLLETIPEGASARDDAEEVHRSADALASLAGELQSAARRRARDAATIDVNDVVSSALPLLRVICGERILMRVALDRSAARIEADPRHITQILLNLAANACAGMQGEGRLVLRTSDADLIWSGPGSAPLPPGRYVVIEMRDSRETPTAAYLDSIFEPYPTSDTMNGLRLPVAHALVTQNNGFVTADAAPEGGLVFRVYLPRHEPESDHPDASTGPKTSS